MDKCHTWNRKKGKDFYPCNWCWFEVLAGSIILTIKYIEPTAQCVKTTDMPSMCINMLHKLPCLCIFCLWHNLCVFKGLLFPKQKRFSCRRGENRFILSLFHLTYISSFVCWYHKAQFSFCLWAHLCFSLSPSDEAAVYKTMQERNGEHFCISLLKNLLCKAISILISTPKSVDAF